MNIKNQLITNNIIDEKKIFKFFFENERQRKIYNFKNFRVRKKARYSLIKKFFFYSEVFYYTYIRNKTIGLTLPRKFQILFHLIFGNKIIYLDDGINIIQFCELIKNNRVAKFFFFYKKINLLGVYYSFYFYKNIKILKKFINYKFYKKNVFLKNHKNYKYTQVFFSENYSNFTYFNYINKIFRLKKNVKFNFHPNAIINFNKKNNFLGSIVIKKNIPIFFGISAIIFDFFNINKTKECYIIFDKLEKNLYNFFQFSFKNFYYKKRAIKKFNLTIIHYFLK